MAIAVVRALREAIRHRAPLRLDQAHPAATSAWHSRPSRPPRGAGQALLEFALVVPLMLALVGITLDFARIYQTWIRLQAVTRDTAELLATDAAYQDQPSAQAAAEARICTAMVGTSACPAYVRPGTVSLAEVGGTTPLWRATVPAEYDFQTYFLYPIIRGLTGSEKWTIRTQMTYEVIRWAQP